MKVHNTNIAPFLVSRIGEDRENEVDGRKDNYRWEAKDGGDVDADGRGEHGGRGRNRMAHKQADTFYEFTLFCAYVDKQTTEKSEVRPHQRSTVKTQAAAYREEAGTM
jgi:hypothetical protein